MPKSKSVKSPFNYKEVYPCPLCRVGEISHMPLMEAMACDFCQQIFTVNLEKQQLIMPSRQPPLTWRWNGVNWNQAHLEGVDLGWGYAIAAILFVGLPTTIIGIVAYCFPPESNFSITWIPYIWTFVTFMSHLSIIIWLLIEIYQIPISSYARAIRQRILN
ncbi:MAG: hypothetical protein AAF378_08580 [Cyanobacteria bacterium P01_A01_bin.84]